MPYEPDNRTLFCCPICRSRYYGVVRVKRSNGTLYATEFYECSGCSVMFRDAVKFTEFKPYQPTAASEAERRKKEAVVAYFEAHTRAR